MPDCWQQAEPCSEDMAHISAGLADWIPSQDLTIVTDTSSTPCRIIPCRMIPCAQGTEQLWTMLDSGGGCVEINYG